jgi:hypothetical protein
MLIIYSWYKNYRSQQHINKFVNSTLTTHTYLVLPHGNTKYDFYARYLHSTQYLSVLGNSTKFTPTIILEKPIKFNKHPFLKETPQLIPQGLKDPHSYYYKTKLLYPNSFLTLTLHFSLSYHLTYYRLFISLLIYKFISFCY